MSCRGGWAGRPTATTSLVTYTTSERRHDRASLSALFCGDVEQSAGVNDRGNMYLAVSESESQSAKRKAVRRSVMFAQHLRRRQYPNVEGYEVPQFEPTASWTDESL
jgi:hypothetical protein